METTHAHIAKAVLNEALAQECMACVLLFLYQVLNLQLVAASTASPQPDSINHMSSPDREAIDLDEIMDSDLFDIPSSPLRPPTSPPYQPQMSPPYQHSSPVIPSSDHLSSVDLPGISNISVLDLSRLEDEIDLQYPEEDIDFSDFEDGRQEGG